MLFVCYPRCSTCQKAKKYLEDRGLSFTLRDIKLQPPTAEELAAWQAKSGLPLKRFFNTSGQSYRALDLARRLPEMDEDAQLALADCYENGRGVPKDANQAAYWREKAKSN